MHRSVACWLVAALAVSFFPAAALAQPGEPRLVRSKQAGAWSAGQTDYPGILPLRQRV